MVPATKATRYLKLQARALVALAVCAVTTLLYCATKCSYRSHWHCCSRWFSPAPSRRCIVVDYHAA